MFDLVEQTTGRLGKMGTWSYGPLAVSSIGVGESLPIYPSLHCRTERFGGFR